MYIVHVYIYIHVLNHQRWFSINPGTCIYIHVYAIHSNSTYCTCTSDILWSRDTVLPPCSGGQRSVAPSCSELREGPHLSSVAEPPDYDTALGWPPAVPGPAHINVQCTCVQCITLHGLWLEEFSHNPADGKHTYCMYMHVHLYSKCAIKLYVHMYIHIVLYRKHSVDCTDLYNAQTTYIHTYTCTWLSIKEF